MDDLVIVKNDKGEVFGAGYRFKDIGLKHLAIIEGDNEVTKLLDNLYIPPGLFVSPIDIDKSEYFKGTLYDTIKSLCPTNKKRKTNTKKQTKTNKKTKKRR